MGEPKDKDSELKYCRDRNLKKIEKDRDKRARQKR